MLNSVSAREALRDRAADTLMLNRLPSFMLIRHIEKTAVSFQRRGFDSALIQIAFAAKYARAIITIFFAGPRSAARG